MNLLPYTQAEFTQKCCAIAMRNSILEMQQNVFRLIYRELNIKTYHDIDEKTFISLGTWYYTESYSQQPGMEYIFNELYDALLSADCPAPVAHNVVNEAEVEFTAQSAYNGNQTPAERLRNVLTPFCTLVQLLQQKQNEPFDPASPMQKIYADSEKICIKDMPRLQYYLADIENFYGSPKL